jgi:cytochrome P450
MAPNQLNHSAHKEVNMTTLSSLIKTNYPGPRYLSLLSYLVNARQVSPDLLYQLAQQYGSVVHVRLGQRPKFLVSGLAGVEHILQNNQHNYRGFDYSHETLRPLLGNGLLTSEGEIWLKHRRLAQQAFHRDQLEKLSKIMVITVRNFLDTWMSRAHSRVTFDVGAEMGLLTIAVVTDALFGNKLGEQAVRVREAWPRVMDHLVGRMLNPFQLPERFPIPNHLEYRKSLGLLNETIYSLISNHRLSAQEGNLLGMLIAARDQQLNIQLDDQELRDEVMTIFLAGHETCANALTWTLYLLAEHPDVQERLAEEVSTVLHGQEPGYADLERLPYTAMVFNEALRLYPPAWIMARDALGNDEIEGWHVPAGATVFLSPYVTHRLPELWEDPLRFDPLRFSSERSSKRPRFAYFPFGGGQRQCLGKNFALIEARLALPLMVQRFWFSLPELRELKNGKRIEYFPTYSMRPQKPIWLTLEKR